MWYCLWHGMSCILYVCCVWVGIIVLEVVYIVYILHKLYFCICYGCAQMSNYIIYVCVVK